MVKVVENNERICTVNLDGSECSIVVQSHYKYFTVKNESDSEVYISLKRDIAPEADGVMTVNSKESATITNMQPNVNMFFASGSGKIQVFASNSDNFVNPFKSAPVAGSGGGVTVCNDNLLINPDFKINQRGISGTFSDTGKYFVDRWRLVSGTVTVNSDGTLTLNGSICQPLENAVGANVTASVSAGTAVYDDTTQTFTITGNGDVISWAKLEYGNAATAFIPPDPATELMKCYRYFYRIGRGIANPNQNANVSRISYQKTSAKYAGCTIRFPIEMRVVPTATISGTPWCFRLFTNDAANAVVAGADSVNLTLQKCGYDIRITNDYFANAVDGFIAPIYTTGYTDFDAEIH